MKEFVEKLAGMGIGYAPMAEDVECVCDKNKIHLNLEFRYGLVIFVTY